MRSGRGARAEEMYRRGDRLAARVGGGIARGGRREHHGHRAEQRDEKRGGRHEGEDGSRGKDDGGGVGLVLVWKAVGMTGFESRLWVSSFWYR